MQWQWWITNFCHLETLFVLLVIVAVLYCLLTGKKCGGKYKTDFSIGEQYDEATPLAPPKKKKKTYRYEEKCRGIFQEIFGVPFKSERPDFLKNPVTGRNLELDGVNYSIRTPMGFGLAFEYDGAQHSQMSRKYHRSVSEFHYQVKKDTFKDIMCRKQGLLLIRIPSFVHFSSLETYIRQQLRKAQMGHYLAKTTKLYD